MPTREAGEVSTAGLAQWLGTPPPGLIARAVLIIGIAGSLVLLGCSKPPAAEPGPAQPASSAADPPAVTVPEISGPSIGAAEPADEPASRRHEPDPARGRELFASRGCADCHGHQAEGMGGEHADDDMTVPTLAQTDLSLQRVIEQVRHPHEYMRSYGLTDVSDTELAAIYAYLQTPSRPAQIVPSVLSHVPPKPTGTIRGVVYYSGSRTPVPDFDIYLLAAEITDDELRYVYDTWFQPSTTTKKDGTFEMPLIRAGHYVLFESRKMQEMTTASGAIALAEVVAGQTTEVEVFVPR
ncbi:MAG: c-type cytochrome [Anaerolineae bacterium]